MIPSSIRGAVISAKETVIVFGILMGYWAGDACSRGMMQNGSNGDDSTSIDWSRLYAMSAILSLPMFGLTFFIPRSLRWLLMHGHPAEALQSMKFVYADRDSAIQLEFDRLQKSMHSIPVHDDAQFDTKQVECGGLLQKLMSPSLWPSFRAAMGLIVLQQCSGQPSVLSFSTLIFRAAGWNGRASVATALVMLCVSVSTIFTVDRWGRKRFLYICCSVLALAASILAWQFWDWKAIDEGHTLSESCKMIVLVAMFAFIGGYQIGFGPITWLIVSEVFPGDVRGAATALGVEWNYLLNFGVQFLVPIAKDTIGWGPTFGMYASILVFAISFIHLYVPETAGMTLEAIEDQLIQRGENDKEGGIALFMETIPTADEQYPLVASPAYKSNSLHSLQYDIDAAHPSYI